jgi:lysophospholipase L1-like esterase
MEKNYLPQVLYWLTYSIIVLFVLSIVPPFTVGSFTYKKINLLADIEPEAVIENVSKSDTLVDTIIDTLVDTVVVASVTKQKVDSCKKGVTCIEDFSLEGNAMSEFVKSLDQVKSRPVRIAFYGDSFIEGDIMTSSLRDTLQRIFGGRGVGYIPITSEVAQFRTTIKHSFANWKTSSIVGEYEEEPRFGIGGYCFEPLEDNTVEYSPGYGARLNRMSIFYTGTSPGKLHYLIRDTVTMDTTLRSSTSLTKIDLNNLRSKSIRLSLEQPDSIAGDVQLFGAAIEEGAGIYVDNLAMRGNSGIGLSRISNSMFREMNNIRPYKLIILQFGLNVVVENDTVQYTRYAASMVRVVNKLKEVFTDCSILVVSVSDRSRNQNGTFKTIPGILAMRQAQRLVAEKTGVAFWDLFAAMGGENSMPKFVNAKPAMAAKDYTHLNFKGGRFVAKKLSDALLYEKERYAKAKPAL